MRGMPHGWTGESVAWVAAGGVANMHVCVPNENSMSLAGGLRVNECAGLKGGCYVNGDADG